MTIYLGVSGDMGSFSEEAALKYAKKKRMKVALKYLIDAVIASERCAELYHLDMLTSGIQDTSPNLTAFIIVQSGA